MSSKLLCILSFIKVFFVFVLLVRVGWSEEDHLFSNSWAVEIKGGSHVANQLAEKHGFINRGLVGSLEDVYHFVHIVSPSRERRSLSSLHPKHHDLVAEEEVSFVEQQVIKARVKRDHKFSYSSPIDAKWSSQWYLALPSGMLSLDQRVVPSVEHLEIIIIVGSPFTSNVLWPFKHRNGGHHMNVELAWEQDIIGRGAVVSILDDGLEHTHPDLRDNYDPQASYDFNSHDNDPFPRYDYTNENKHGTRCAGEVAANRNGKCGVGAAYGAKVGGVRMLDGDVTDVVEAGSLSLKPDHIDIYSSSWGPSDDGTTVDGPGTLAKKAFVDGVTKGRGGLGSIFVWAAGNGGRSQDSCNCDGYAVSPYTVSVGSVSERDNKPWYLERCSSTLTSTYSSGDRSEKQIVSTDLHGKCTNHHTGTSASAPLAAGILALALEVNQNLTWRDVQYLVIYSSNPSFPHDSNWQTNGAGLKGSHLYGFGILDAAVLVNRARNWISVPSRENCTMDVTSQLDGNRRTTSGKPLIVEIHTDGCGLSYLEHVQVITTLSMVNRNRGSVTIEITSPMGTKSTLLPYRSSDLHHEGFHKWPFMTVLSWGEKPSGNWIFTVTTKDGALASLDGLELVFYGTSDVPAAIQSIPESCHEQCSGGCAKTGAEFCDTCKKVRVSSTRECVQMCPVGTFENIHMCRACPEFCGECEDDHTCIKCQSGAVRLENGECAGECPDLSYTDANDNCVSCHHSCLSCNGPTESNCTSCPGQLSLGEDGTCSIRSPLSCLDGTYFDHRKLECISCHMTCAKCSGKESTQCTQCIESYVLTDNGRCIDIRQLQNCDSGQFFNSSASSCIPCPSLCVNCSNEAKCLSCIDNYYLLSDGTCVESCPEHTVTDNQTNVCLDTACHESCLACFGTKDSQCISCFKNMLLFEGSCIEECPNGTYKTENYCKHCQRSCAECAGPNADQCLSCPLRTYLQSNRCVKTCPSGSFSDPTGLCLLCPSKCSNCSNANRCTVCSKGYYLLTANGSCVSECPLGFVAKISNNVCYPCLPNCDKCSDQSSCLKCEDNFSYYEPNRSCLTRCPDGFFTNSNSICSSCKTPCSTCSDSPTNCLGCEGKFAMNLTSKTCQSCCSADTNNAPCCDCDANDETCVWVTSIPTPRPVVYNENVLTATSLLDNTLFKATLAVAVALLIVTILLVAMVIGIRVLRKRPAVKMPNLNGMKLPTLNGSQKYTIIPGSDNGGLELQDDTYSESEMDIFDSKDQMTTV